MTTAICLKSIGNIAEFTFNGDLKTDNITKIIPKSVRRTIGYGKLKKQHEFLRGDVKISLFAWTDGEAGDENKHELPPPIDKYLYFGNSFSSHTKIIFLLISTKLILTYLLGKNVTILKNWVQKIVGQQMKL